jgi:hypothetical protein
MYNFGPRKFQEERSNRQNMYVPDHHFTWGYENDTKVIQIAELFIYISALE